MISLDLGKEKGQICSSNGGPPVIAAANLPLYRIIFHRIPGGNVEWSPVEFANQKRASRRLR